MTEPTEITVEDVAKVLLRTTLLAFAAREDVYIPHQGDLAEFLWLRAVLPLLQDAIRDTQWANHVPAGKFAQYATEHPLQAAVRCLRPDPHDTHLWRPSWNPEVEIRCPGRES